MAGDWIKMRIDLQSHPKIVRILSATDSDKFRAIGGLHAVWSIFDTHSEDGVLLGYSAKTLDHVIGWQGFTDAMISVGWVEEVVGGLVMPGFDEHNGKSGKRRAEDQKRKREGRKCPQPVRNPSENEEDGLWTREEKRREEIKDQKPCPQQADDGQVKEKIPFEKIRLIYNEVCKGVLSEAIKLDDKRKRNIRKCWAMNIAGATPFQSGDFWRQYFTDCLDDPHWTGSNEKGWRADIEFLTRESSVLKVLERT